MKKDTIVAYKGFDANFKCKEFQYEVGKTYKHEGAVALCKTGFHAVEFPLDAFIYYSPATSVWAEVALAGVTDEKKEDSKRVGSEITIKAKMTLMDFIKAHVQIVIKKADKNIGTGDSGHAAATGDSGHAAATGDSGHAAATQRPRATTVRLSLD